MLLLTVKYCKRSFLFFRRKQHSILHIRIQGQQLFTFHNQCDNNWRYHYDRSRMERFSPYRLFV